VSTHTSVVSICLHVLAVKNTLAVYGVLSFAAGASGGAKRVT